MTERYRRGRGYAADCEVIYGDTDSVMVDFKVRPLASLTRGSSSDQSIYRFPGDLRHLDVGSGREAERGL